MGNTGVLSFTTITSVDYAGGVAWTNPSNALTSNNVYATNAPLAYSDWIWAVNPNPAIASDAVIDGIYVEMDIKANKNCPSDMYAQVIKAGALVGTVKSQLGWQVLTTESTYYFGSSADTWGNTLTGADVNNANFGIAFRLTDSAAQTPVFSLDWIRVTIYYTPVVNKTLSDLVSSVTETVSKETATYDYIPANNNQAYILNLRTKAWTFIDNYPFSNVIYRPRFQTMIGARRDTGNLAALDSGTTFDGTDITWTLQTGFYDFGKLDEMKSMPDDASQALKRLRAIFSEVKSSGDITLTVFTENDSIGQTFTISPTTTDNVVYNMVRTALSRDIRGKYISFQFSASVPAYIGETSVKIQARAIR